MCSLLGFPPLPPEGHVTLCEIEAKVCHMPAETADVTAFTNVLSTLPKVAITNDLHTTIKEDARQVFVPVTETLLKRFITTLIDHGVTDAFRILTEPQEAVDWPMLAACARTIVKGFSFLSLVQNSLSPHLQESGEHLVAAVCQTNNWICSPIKTLAWHPHCNKLAIATWDSSVRIFSSDSPNLTPALKCKGQRLVSCLAWRPLSASELALGCQEGVIVWQVDPKSVVSRPSASCATILRRPGHSPVTSVTWNPLGSLLLSASAADTAMYMWDVDFEEPVVLRRVGGGGVSLVSWAPDSAKVFAATSGVVFRVWDSDRWVPERWRVQSGHVRAACWSPCGSVLLFATSDKALVYALQFTRGAASLDSVFRAGLTDDEDSQSARVVINLEPVELEGCGRVGGVVVSMVWDPKGRYLAVLFENCPVVAMFLTEVTTPLQVSPCCFVRGTPGEIANVIAFHPNFPCGSCLTIATRVTVDCVAYFLWMKEHRDKRNLFSAWSSGRVQYFPLVYKALSCPRSHQVAPNSSAVITSPVDLAKLTSPMSASRHPEESLMYHSF